MVKQEGISDNGLMFTFKTEGDSAHMTTPTGQSYTAKLDGTETPYRGDPGTTIVSDSRLLDPLRRSAHRVATEEAMRGAKPVRQRRAPVPTPSEPLECDARITDCLQSLTGVLLHATAQKHPNVRGVAAGSSDQLGSSLMIAASVSVTVSPVKVCLP